MTLPTLYGIPNCDSVRKARGWLETHQIDYRFVNFKETPVEVAVLKNWLEVVGATQLVNRRSTTYRQLEEADKNALEKADIASVLAKHPTVIKRPVLYWKGDVSVGFSAADYAHRFNR
jgi:Spx/MgsR family transcriptional regulator